MKKPLIILALSLASTSVMAMGRVPRDYRCVEREDQISSVATIKDFVAKMGGMSNIEGSWRLGGMAGSFKKVIISFQSANDGLKALIEGLDGDGDVTSWGAIKVCETNRADTLRVTVLKSNDSLYMRKGSGAAMQLAQIKDGQVGTFYTFNKIR